MAATCKICGKPNQSKKDLYCRTHQRKVLQSLEQSGYLEPLTVTTVAGQQKLSNRRFLTLQDEA